MLERECVACRVLFCLSANLQQMGTTDCMSVLAQILLYGARRDERMLEEEAVDNGADAKEVLLVDTCELLMCGIVRVREMQVTDWHNEYLSGPPTFAVQHHVPLLGSVGQDGLEFSGQRGEWITEPDSKASLIDWNADAAEERSKGFDRQIAFPCAEGGGSLRRGLIA
jgi:hypothetical protein